MPSWFPMGELSPSVEWQLWPNTTEGELFRLTHIWTPSNWYRPRGLVAQFWDDDQASPAIKVWAKEVAEDLIELKIPDAYQQTGNTLRKIGVLLLPPRRTVIPVEVNWGVALEVFDPN